MLIFLLIYVSGIIAALLLGYHCLDEGTEFTLSELSFAILMSVFSWVAFIIVILIAYGDKVVFKKK